VVRCQYKNFTARHPSADSYQDGRERKENLGVKKRKLIKKSPDFFFFLFLFELFLLLIPYVMYGKGRKKRGP